MIKSRNNLIGKTVMSQAGIPIGVVIKSLFDTKSGKNESLLINPSNKIDPTEYTQNKQGEIILPLDYISNVKDVVVFEKKE